MALPGGTQVVLKRDHPVVNAAPGANEQARFKKSGIVGVVAEAPFTNEYAYVIRFADGTTVRAKQKDLSLRRTDAPEDELPAGDAPYLVFKFSTESPA